MKRIIVIVSLLFMVISAGVQASGQTNTQPNTRAWYYLQRQAQLRQQNQNNLQDENSQNMQEQDSDEQFFDANEPQVVLERCPVCLTDESADTTLNCGHKFCGSCIDQWLSDHTTCPLCRKKDVYKILDPKDHIFDFNRKKLTGPKTKKYRLNTPTADGDFIVPAQYQQEIRDFIASLTPEEYSALIVQYETPEFALFLSPAIVDQSWLPLDQRMALFRKGMGLSYNSSVIPNDEQYHTERKKRTEKREHDYALGLPAMAQVSVAQPTPASVARSIIQQRLADNQNSSAAPRQLSSARHQFNFNRYNNSSRAFDTVAPQFHQEVRDFILALTDEEYTALMNRHGNAPEFSVSLNPTWLDADWLTLEQRKNNFRRDMGLSYNESMAVQFVAPDEKRELSARQNRRSVANLAAALASEY